ncbi:MAG: M28 family peptidase [Planctomycetota bacterium]
MLSVLRAAAVVAAISAVLPAHAERAYMAAVESVRVDHLRTHIEVLASDAYEGRQAGRRGGRAAAEYLAGQLKRLEIAGGARGGGYFQPFYGGRRNVLAVIPGADPELRDEWIVVGAHYDHVGYGDRRNSFGPIGFIHNGADDNASGVAAVLEFCEAARLTTFHRSVLIAFWDGEEEGMLGSKHWVANPTTPLASVAVSVNLDMVGRLREGRLEVGGTRTGYGLRRLASVAYEPDLWLDFSWQLEPNSDHWTFLSRGVPTLILHTGLHDQYHRPSDDVETLNLEGIQTVGRYVVDLVGSLADAPKRPRFRPEGRSETPALQRTRQRPLPPLPPGAAPPRVGFSWREDHAAPRSVLITRVVPGSPAEAAGVRLMDRVLSIDGQPPAGPQGFQERLFARLEEPAPEVALEVERRGRVERLIVRVGQASP